LKFLANDCQELVRVETQLQQIGHKKRKEVSSPIMRVSSLLNIVEIKIILLKKKHFIHRITGQYRHDGGLCKSQ
jgi:hypothetical protein